MKAHGKIFLIEPSVDAEMREKSRTYDYLPPLWAVALATYLRRKNSGLKIKILDGRLISEKDIKSAISNDKPDLIGLSPKFPNYASTIDLARFAKKWGAKVILGGAHAAHLRREILGNRGPFSSDYCVDGIIEEDGEVALDKYISGWPPQKIKNFVWQEGRGKIRENPVEFLDLDKLPPPDFSLVNLADYFKKRRVLPVYSQKGCRWRIESKGGCLFCGQTGFSLRFKNPVKFWEEISGLKQVYKVQTVWDSSEDFLNDLSWFDNFHKLSFSRKMKPGLKIFLRIARINNVIAGKLKDLNIAELLMGVESGSQKSLSALRKGSSVSHNLKAIEALHRENIKTFCCFVLGAPGESLATVKETIKLAKKLIKLPQTSGVRFNTLVPFPGSLAWQMLLKKTGSKYKDRDLIDWSEVCRDWIRYFCRIPPGDYSRVLKEARKTTGQI